MLPVKRFMSPGNLRKSRSLQQLLTGRPRVTPLLVSSNTFYQVRRAKPIFIALFQCSILRNSSLLAFRARELATLITSYMSILPVFAYKNDCRLVDK